MTDSKTASSRDLRELGLVLLVAIPFLLWHFAPELDRFSKDYVFGDHVSVTVKQDGVSVRVNVSWTKHRRTIDISIKSARRPEARQSEAKALKAVVLLLEAEKQTREDDPVAVRVLSTAITCLDAH